MSSDTIAIRVQDLSKNYQIYDAPRDRLKQFLLPRIQRLLRRGQRRYFNEFYALKDVSFNLLKGETVGIIGVNGSGKSTLLQVICGTLAPSCGTVETHGRIAALLELGSGFNPEFTGRENVFMNAAILGFSKKETEERFNDIAAFADIGEFIEQPVKMYSSGMVVRLAFAVNIVSQPDIMVVDEALAVGDMNFQAKCMTALTRIQEKGATILFVSHDVGAVRSLCSRCIYLEKGAIKAIGKASEVAELYVRDMREEMNEDIADISEDKKVDTNNSLIAIDDKLLFKQSEEFDRQVEAFRYGSGEARITFADLLNDKDQPIRHVEFDQEIKIVISFESFIENEISCNFYIIDNKRILILGSGNRLADKELLRARKNGRYTFVYTLRMPLEEGNYSIQLQITTPLILDKTAEFLDVIDDAVVFQILPRPGARVWAKVHIPNTLEIIEA